VGTISIERSELLSKMLKKAGVPHNVLNAKHHEKEAQIVAQAGKFCAVTIATNMAGRGTDIMLGGNADFMAKDDLRKQNIPEELLAEADSYAETDDPEILAVRQKYEDLLMKYKEEIADEAEKVRAAGGLYIIGTERHESRRIDNQLRGRAGRQGDPGESRFYLSLQDDLMRLFSTDRVIGLMDTLGIDEDTPIDARILSNAVENAQRNVESRNFRSRKSVLEYDDVMNVQREVIYAQRQKVLDGEDLRQTVMNMLRDFIDSTVSDAMSPYGGKITQEELPEIIAPFDGIYFPKNSFEAPKKLDTQSLCDAIFDQAESYYAKKEEEISKLNIASTGRQGDMREVERVIMLR